MCFFLRLKLFFKEFHTFAAMAKKKFYVVWKGRHPGIYDDWEVCKKEIIGCKGALFKGFSDLQSAENAFNMNYETYVNSVQSEKVGRQETEEKPNGEAIAVDAACSVNPGKMEYRGVLVETGQEIFHSPIFAYATNNIGEFLAIVHALAFQKHNNWKLPIYSDSINAQLWVRQKKCKTKLQLNDKNKYLFELIARAEKWLNENAIEVPILKWKTEIWGEIPADFGRK